MLVEIPYLSAPCSLILTSSHATVATLPQSWCRHSCPLSVMKSWRLLTASAVIASQLSEIVILEAVEKLTDTLATEGEWITKIDLVEQGGKLAVVEQVRTWQLPAAEYGRFCSLQYVHQIPAS